MQTLQQFSAAQEGECSPVRTAHTAPQNVLAQSGRQALSAQTGTLSSPGSHLFGSVGFFQELGGVGAVGSWH